jgi:PDZ domain
MQVLASEINVGYEEIVNTQVNALNGHAINNLSDLVEAVESSREKYLKFDLEYNQTIVLETKVCGWLASGSHGGRRPAWRPAHERACLISLSDSIPV